MDFEKIKYLSRKKAISLRELAENARINESSLYRIFKEKSIKVETLELISEALGVSPTIFFEQTDMVNDDQGVYLAYKSNINNGDNNTIALENKSKELELLKKEVEMLRTLVLDKQKLIDIYEKQLLNLSKKN